MAFRSIPSMSLRTRYKSLGAVKAGGSGSAFSNLFMPNAVSALPRPPVGSARETSAITLVR
jgi:hypothetical protein